MENVIECEYCNEELKEESLYYYAIEDLYFCDKVCLDEYMNHRAFVYLIDSKQ